MINLCHDWLHSYFPHTLSKINRVSFGLLSPTDLERARALDPHMPKTRKLLAIPFVGKDVPSRASEFAHPDIVIGLTILAFRFQGLRQSDFFEALKNLRAEMMTEVGPYNKRPSCRIFSNWINSAGGRVRGERREKLQGTKTRPGTILVGSMYVRRSRDKARHFLFRPLKSLWWMK